MGFSEIYLIGVDMTFSDQKVKKKDSRNWTAEKDDDPNHFDPRYFGKGKSYHNPTVHEMIEQFEIGKVFFEENGVKIFNAGVGGKLDVFPRIQFVNLFSNTTQNLSLFLEYFGFETIEDLEQVLVEANDLDLENMDSYPDYIRVKSNEWNPYLKKMIGSHVHRRTKRWFLLLCISERKSVFRVKIYLEACSN